MVPGDGDVLELDVAFLDPADFDGVAVSHLDHVDAVLFVLVHVVDLEDDVLPPGPGDGEDPVVLVLVLEVG